MATYSNPGSTAMSTWSPEERAAKRAELEAKSRALVMQRANQTAGPISNAQGSAQANQAPSLSQVAALGIGDGGSEIVAGRDANGIATFTNRPSSLNTVAPTFVAPGSQATPTPRTASLTDAGSASQAQGPSSFGAASAGSMSNLGNGIGTFSQMQAGDSARALRSYENANQIRQSQINQERLDRAAGRQDAADSLTIVRDSSRPLSLGDLVRNRADDARAAQESQQRLQSIANAQGLIGADLKSRAGEQALRQAASLEDLRVAAVQPDATPEAVRNYQLAADPAGYLKVQRESGFDQLKAQGQQITNQLNQQKLADAQVKSTTTADAKASGLTLAREARDLASSIGASPAFSDITGTINSRTPTVRGESQDLINQTNRLQALLTMDNLKLMTGVLTDRDIAFLGQISSGINVTENGIRGSEQGTRERLAQIVQRLDSKLQAGEPSQGQSAQPEAAARISSDAEYDALPSGATFVDPDGNIRRKP